MDASARKLRRERRAEAIAENRRRARELQTIQQNEDLGKVQEVLQEHLSVVDDSYQYLSKNLDGTTSDARIVREIVNLGSESAKRINASTKSFELKPILQRLIREQGDLKSLMKHIAYDHAAQCLQSAPTFEFFYGTIKSEDLEIKERKKRTRVEIVESKKVATAAEKQIDVDVEQDSTPKEVEFIYNHMVKVPDDTSIFETLVDPKSFTKTVENIFHASFLVKEGKIGVKDDWKLTKDYQGNQNILSFNMEDYRNWISTYNIEEAALERHSEL